MKKIILLGMVLAFSLTVTAQTKQEKPVTDETAVVESKAHKIVFHLSTDDTLVHKSLMKQLNNMITVAPSSKIEVVCQGPGLTILMSGKTIVQEKIIQLKKKNIEFVVCEFSMSEKNITKDKMIPEAGFVKYGILEIVSKQEQGWSYIRSGF